MNNGDLNWIANYIWGIADDILRDRDVFWLDIPSVLGTYNF